MAPIIVVTLPSDGDTALAENIDDPINAILAVVNGNLDDTNIASMNGSKIVAGSLPATALSTAAAQGWNPISQTPVYGANNGNREFTVTFTGIDLTTIVPVGAKFKLTRGTTAPTQAMAFVSGSSQYATLASPTNITFTGPFTCEAWIFPQSYTGNTQAIISATNNGTAGFQFIINSVGQVLIQYNTAGPVTTNFISQQSVPLNRWTHTAGVVTSVSSKTGVIYIDGASVPIYSTSTSATALTQGGNLSIGALGAGIASTFFNGFISEARVWSVAQTQSAIQSNMGISLVGTETNLNFLAQGNGNFNDKTSNANNLTATGGAIATQVVNPYNNIEYALVTKTAVSGGNSTLTLFAGRQSTVPNMILNSANWSIQRTPFGFPASKGNWSVDMLILNSVSASGSTANTIYNPGGINLNVPTGEWSLRAQMMVQVSTSADPININFGVSTSNSAFLVGTRLCGQIAIQQANSTNGHIFSTMLIDGITTTTLTPYYLIVLSQLTFSQMSIDGAPSSLTPQASIVTAESSYV